MVETNVPINEVIHWDDDTVSAFGPDGQEKPEYHGKYEELKEKILADAPEDAKWYKGQRPFGVNEVKKEDW